MIWVKGFPMPPSVNKALMPVPGKMKFNKNGQKYFSGRWVKTASHRDYWNDCLLWRIQNQQAFLKIQKNLLDAKRKVEASGGAFALRVDYHFVFHVEHVFTKGNEVLRNDADNRLKPCQDAISRLLGIDDRYFFAGQYEKLTTHSKDLECAILRISLFRPRMLPELQAQINQETDT